MRKEQVIDKIEVLEGGHLQIRRAAYFIDDDGTRTHLGYHRVSYAPGDDVTHEDEAVRQHAAVAWPPSVVRAHQAAMQAKAAARAERHAKAAGEHRA